MSINRRIVAVSAVLGVMALAGVLLLQSHAQAGSHFNVSKLNTIQRRLLSGFLSTALAPTNSKRSPIDTSPGIDEGLSVAPSSFVPRSGSGGGLPANYFPDVNGTCGGHRGDDTHHGGGGEKA